MGETIILIIKIKFKFVGEKYVEPFLPQAFEIKCKVKTFIKKIKNPPTKFYFVVAPTTLKWFNKNSKEIVNFILVI